MRANLSFTQNYTLNRKAFPGGAGGMFGRRVLLFRKRRAVIPEALGAYSGSARRLFWKRRALISEGRGGLDEVAWRFGWECGVVFGEMRGVVVVWERFLGGDDVYFLYKYAVKGFFMLILGQKCEFWVLARIRENTYLCGGDIIFSVQTTTKMIQL